MTGEVNDASPRKSFISRFLEVFCLAGCLIPKPRKSDELNASRGLSRFAGIAVSRKKSAKRVSNIWRRQGLGGAL
jgi:hypothetical protein